MSIEGVFHSTIKRYGMIEKGDGIVVGLSGGPDSTALFHLLYRFMDYYGITLVAAHLNHNFRPGDAEQDADYVRQFCMQRNIPCVIEFCDVPAFAKREGLSSEQAGRIARYSFFDSVMRKQRCNKIAVAHNQNDNIETVLMRFIRGAGMEGLGGIHPVRGHIIRPLMEVMRDDIEQYCALHRLDPVTDRSNLKPVYTRNKVRLELLPYLRGDYNSNIDRAIVDMAYLFKEENDYMHQTALAGFKRALVSKGNNRLDLSVDKLIDLHNALLRRVLRVAIEYIKGDKYNLEYKHIEDLCCLLNKAQTGRQLCLPGGITAYICYDKLLLVSGTIDTEGIDNMYVLNIPGTIYISDTDAVLSASVLTREHYEKRKNGEGRFTAYFDWNKIGDRIILRKRKPGDRFKPLGMQGTKKLKDFLMDLKIPRHQRDAIPVIHNGFSIVWVVGYRISEDFKVTSDTDVILKIGYKQLDGEGNGLERWDKKGSGD